MDGNRSWTFFFVSPMIDLLDVFLKSPSGLLEEPASRFREKDGGRVLERPDLGLLPAPKKSSHEDNPFDSGSSLVFLDSPWEGGGRSDKKVSSSEFFFSGEISSFGNSRVRVAFGSKESFLLTLLAFPEVFPLVFRLLVRRLFLLPDL